ncbi:LysM peptidoglycan-binding domain-containing protein [Fibrella forsythiae]|uniref:LysM peptidoglycan-binding domain-containing protein n=1 Tax=Fibrella forsythiae TaxID=2817061 RepID=A0ABS3JAN9_9BACT|nr:LysM peptidoglycan-binding domain-containing protein [Fibrella forsythiae]MBO0947060.1 LysM peptidoglycan-binding domain-containing protein [Fibrella forsythiae]
MNRLINFAIPSLLLLAHATHASSTPPSFPVDSVGIERKDGKRFVLHRVDQGQTLYAVARRYNSTVDAIKSANPDLTENSVRYDQLLRVPVVEVTLSRREQRDAEKAQKKAEKEKQQSPKEAEELTADDVKNALKPDSKVKPKPEKLTEKPASARPAGSSSTGIHVVESGQTLYSLAVRYNVTMADIRRWNDLGADGIQVGQSLIVSEKAFDAKKAEAGTTKAKPTSAKAAENEVAKLEAKPIITPDPLPTPGTKPKPKPTEAKPTEAKPADSKPAEKSPEAKPTERAVTSPKTTEPRSDNEPVSNTRKTNMKSDVGFADLIEGNDSSTKYLALHRTAPVGTLVQVRNDITNQSLYVKVIGKLPDTGINNQVLIRLSARAFEKLSPNGQRFRAEVSYSN